jgi:hypothetical protein
MTALRAFFEGFAIGSFMFESGNDKQHIIVREMKTVESKPETTVRVSKKAMSVAPTMASKVLQPATRTCFVGLAAQNSDAG